MLLSGFQLAEGGNMSKWIYLCVGLLLGFGASQYMSTAVAQSGGVKPAYLIVSGRTLPDADLAAYRAAARRLPSSQTLA